MPPVEIRYLTDPACPWSWGSEPKLLRLRREFGEGLRIVRVMGGMARQYGPEYRDEEGSIGSGAGCFEDLIAHWLDIAEETGMPCDPRIWSQNPISSTYPACMAVKAAGEQGAELEGRYLRRVREGLMVERRKLDTAEALIAEAAPAGLDVERFRIDVHSEAIVEKFATDLDEVRTIPDEAREQGQAKKTEGIERLSFPSLVFIGAAGERHGVWGWSPYDAYREAALAAGAEPVDEVPLEPLDALSRFERLATKELEALADRQGPPLEAELWKLASEWKVKPVSVLTGTLWEEA